MGAHAAPEPAAPYAGRCAAARRLGPRGADGHGAWATGGPGAKATARRLGHGRAWYESDGNMSPSCSPPPGSFGFVESAMPPSSNTSPLFFSNSPTSCHRGPIRTDAVADDRSPRPRPSIGSSFRAPPIHLCRVQSKPALHGPRIFLRFSNQELEFTDVVLWGFSVLSFP